LGISGFNEQIRKQVRDTYKVDIKDQGVLTQMAQIIKQSYGGSISLGIRSPQLRDLIMLYAQTTGQNFPLQNKQRPFFLTEQGGTLFQAPTYQNGQSISYAGGLPTIAPTDRSIAGAPQGPMNLNATLQLDPAATTAVLTGQAANVISSSPRLVADSVMSASQGNYGRTEQVRLGISPLAIGG
jgi:hypothetical protein